MKHLDIIFRSGRRCSCYRFYLHWPTPRLLLWKLLALLYSGDSSNDSNKDRWWLLSSSCNPVDMARSWSDSCAIASSFTLSLSLRELLRSSNSCILLCISAPCRSSWGMLRNVRYGSVFLNNSACSDSFLLRYVEQPCQRRWQHIYQLTTVRWQKVHVLIFFIFFNKDRIAWTSLSIRCIVWQPRQTSQEWIFVIVE
jgi:hypothetical protein